MCLHMHDLTRSTFNHGRVQEPHAKPCSSSARAAANPFLKTYNRWPSGIELQGLIQRCTAALSTVRLRNYIDPTHDDWEHLTAAEFAIRNAYQESIKTTPFMLKYGQNPLTPASLRIPRIQNPEALTLTGTLQERLARAKMEYLLSKFVVCKTCV